jgi:peptide/nickel transport system ATP-binding protein
MSEVLEVSDYSLGYRARDGMRMALEEFSLAIGAGEVVGLVGESGSGKSSLAWAVMRALPGNAVEGGGTIRLGGTDLRRLDAAAIRAVRGRRIGMVFQDPSLSLNPTLSLGRQMTEVFARHRGLDRHAATHAAEAALAEVDIRSPAALMRRYPHQASGGEKQRVAIAMAFAARPELILFDEPTTALDVITGARILELFARLRASTGVAALFISHDLGLVARVADRVSVLRYGRVVETGAPRAVFAAPAHEYTRMLVEAVPRPGLRRVADMPTATTLLAADGISVRYARRRLFRAAPQPATHAVNFEIRSGEILGIVGESGSGKSSLARALTGLAGFDGAIHTEARRVGSVRDMDRAYRRAVQIVFQNPDASLNPRQRVGAILARPLRLFGSALAEIPRLLEQVRLPAGTVDKYPHQLSGGEKQRVAIARAFAARPALVICDEITAALDVSVQAQVIALLLALRAAHGTAYLFITHDLNLVRQIAHRIGVMQAGTMVELRDAAAFDGPDAHPYTRALIAASPDPVGAGDRKGWSI